VNGNATDQGALYAVGTEAEPITFQRRTGNRWSGITFDGSGYDPLPSTLDHCQINEPGYGNAVGVEFVGHKNCTLRNSTVWHAQYWGAWCDEASAPTFENCTFDGCGYYPLGFDIDSPPTLLGNTYINNAHQSINIYGDVAEDVTLPEDGVPYDRLGGNGTGNIDVYNGATLTLLPSTTIMFTYKDGVTVGWDPVNGVSDQGALIAEGTLAEPIQFVRSSGYNWGQIRFDGGAGSPMASSISHCRLDYPGYENLPAIQFAGHSNCTVSDSTVYAAQYWGVWCDEASAPTLADNTFQSGGYYPMAFDADSPPVLTGNTYTANARNLIYLYGDVAVDSTLPNDGIPYDRPHGLGYIDVYDGATLTLLPGTTMQLEYSTGLNVGWDPVDAVSDQGALVAVGTATDPIRLVRTSGYNWGQIVFDGRAGSAMASAMKYCTLDRAGYNSIDAVKFLDHSNVEIYRCQILSASGRGIHCDATSRPSLVFNKVAYCGWEPVRIAAENADALDRNVYSANGRQYIAVYGDVTRDVIWPHEKYPYWPEATFTVRNGATPTLSPGVVLGLEYNIHLYVGQNVNGDETDRGGIVALGTPDKIVWISQRTGYNGGSVIIDGTGYSPALPSEFEYCTFYNLAYTTGWWALHINGNDDVELRMCTVYGAANNGIRVTACSPTIDSCIVSQCGRYGILGIDGATPTIRYTDSWGNAWGNWLDVTPDGTCIEENPLFFSGYLGLQPGSPCIDTGNPAFDVGDGTTADMGSHQSGGEITSPVGFFNAGWNWFSIPLPPSIPGDASNVLGFEARNILYRWDPDNKNTELYPDDFTNLEPKRGYMLRLGGAPSVTYRARGYVTSQTIPVPFQGATMIGLPSLSDTALEDLQIRNRESDETRDAWDDRNAAVPWMNWNWIYWDSVSRQAMICALAGGDDDTMRAWYGYRVWTYVDDLELLLPAVRTRGNSAPPTADVPSRISPRPR
jgi:hypothetical protein